MLSATKAMYKITSPLNQPVLTAYSPKITAPRMLKALDKDEGVFNDASRSPSIITSMIKSCAKTGIAAVCSIRMKCRLSGSSQGQRSARYQQGVKNNVRKKIRIRTSFKYVPIKGGK